MPLQREVLDAWLAPGDDPEASAENLNAYAWALLTYEVPGLQDPARALEFAKRACEREAARGGSMLWAYLDTLALAQHRSGDTGAAVATQKRALERMPAGADEGVRQRLAEYEAALEDGSGD